MKNQFLDISFLCMYCVLAIFGIILFMPNNPYVYLLLIMQWCFIALQIIAGIIGR